MFNPAPPSVKWAVARGRVAQHLAAMRITSLLASATEIVYALGIGDRLNAVSHECDYPPEVGRKPRVSRARFEAGGMSSPDIDRAVRSAMREHGSPFAVDEHRLRDAHPDLLLTQEMCDVCAVPTTLAEQAIGALDHRPDVVSLHAHRIDDILASIVDVGRAAGVEARAHHVVNALRERIQAVADAVRDADIPTVLAVEWLDPVFVPGHWVPEMFAAAGGALLFGEAGTRSRQTTWSDISGHDPDVLVIMPCGFDLAVTQQEASRYAALLHQAAPRAVEGGRAFVVDGSAYFSRSGPRFVEGIEILSAILHPDRCRQYQLEGRGARWSPPARS